MRDSRHAKRMTQGLLAVSLLGILLSAAGCRKGHAPDLDGDGDAAHSSAPAPMLPPDVLQLTPAQQRQLGLVITAAQSRRLPQSWTTTAPLSVPAGRSATVTSPINGYAGLWKRHLAAPGESVHAGEVLALVRQAYSTAERMQLHTNERLAQSQTATLQAKLAADRAQQQRSRKLYADGIAPLRQVQQDSATVAGDRAALADAQARQAEYHAALGSQSAPGNPSVTLLRAPISGTVAAVNLTPGQMVDPAQPLFTIIDDSRIWLQIPVPEDQLALARQARSAVFSVASFPGQWFPLTPVGSSGVVDPQTHTLPMIFAAANRGHSLHPGMIATVQMLAPAQQARPVIPASALVHEGAVTVVFVAAGNHQFRRSPVEVQYISAGQAAIAHGLQAGDRVVSQGAALLESELHVGNVQGDDD